MKWQQKLSIATGMGMLGGLFIFSVLMKGNYWLAIASSLAGIFIILGSTLFILNSHVQIATRTPSKTRDYGTLPYLATTLGAGLVIQFLAATLAAGIAGINILQNSRNGWLLYGVLLLGTALLSWAIGIGQVNSGRWRVPRGQLLLSVAEIVLFSALVISIALGFFSDVSDVNVVITRSLFIGFFGLMLPVLMEEGLIRLQ
ncbi:MAG: hypothetical protein ACYC55_03395 [Candidatus Geothermincolia bacterium]